MNFPVWELEMGTPLLIAIVAILHVYVSHFAIGGGLFLVVTEHFANRKDDRHLRNYLITQATLNVSGNLLELDDRQVLSASVVTD